MTIVIPQARIAFGSYLILSLRYSVRRKPLIAIALVPWLLSVWTVGILLTRPVAMVNFLKNAPLGSLFMLFYLLLPLLTVWGTWRQYKTSNFLQHAAVYTLNADGVSIRSLGINIDLQWGAFIRADRFGSWLLLQTSEQSAFFLDLQQAAAHTNPVEILEMVKSGGVSVR